MPFTPLHLGPGLIAKAGARDSLSFTVFAFSQVAMDLEVLGRILAGSEGLHGLSNTALGATIILVPSVLIGRPLGQWALRWWNSRLSPSQARWVSVAPGISWKAAWIGGVLGVYSHFFLDAVMHVDAEPWAPFSEENPWLGLISIRELDSLCFWMIGIGLGALAISWSWRARGTRKREDV